MLLAHLPIQKLSLRRLFIATLRRATELWLCPNTVMEHNKNGCTFSKGASCSYPLGTRGPCAVTPDPKTGTATPYMEGANGRCQKALLFLHREALQFALRGFVFIPSFLWKYRACIAFLDLLVAMFSLPSPRDQPCHVSATYLQHGSEKTFLSEDKH